MAEFHPVIWMFNDQFSQLKYSYFNRKMIIEEETGTYADRDADLKGLSITWNHELSEVVNALLTNKLAIECLLEYDYSPYNCFNNTIEIETGKFQISGHEGILPMVYALKATKQK